MTRTASVAAAALAVLAATTAVAIGGSRTLRGEVRNDARASVAVTVVRKGGDRRVTGFTARRFAITCEGGIDARLGSAALTGTAPVTKRGRFVLRASNDRQRFAVRGVFAGSRRARGSFSFSGRTRFDGPDRECRSGKLAWTASRDGAARRADASPPRRPAVARARRSAG